MNRLLNFFNKPTKPLWGTFGRDSNDSTKSKSSSLNSQVKEGDLFIWLNGKIYNTNLLRKKYGVKNGTVDDILRIAYIRDGLDFIKTLNGKYIIIIWDKFQRKAYFIRDRLGIHSLYYHFTNTFFVFASQAKILLSKVEGDKGFNWKCLLNLRPNCDPKKGLQTYFKNIYALPPASILTLDIESLNFQINKYWRIDDFISTNSNYTETYKIIEEYKELLIDAIQIRLTHANKHYLQLSDGLDSSTIAFIAAQDNRLEASFSLTTSDLFISEVAEDIRAYSKSIEVKNHQLLIDYHKTTPSLIEWKKLLWLCENPRLYIDGFAKFQLNQSAAAFQTSGKSMLSGFGSDQFNGGNARLEINPFYSTEELNWNHYNRYLQNVEKQRISSQKKYVGGNLLNYMNINALREKESSLPTTWIQHVHRMSNNLSVDSLSMEKNLTECHGFSLILPFLDHRIVEFVANIPEKFYADLFFDKQIMRKAVSGFLPDFIQTKLKIPTQNQTIAAPDTMFLRMLLANDREMVREALDKNDFIDGEAIHHYLDEAEATGNFFRLHHVLTIVNAGLLDKMIRDSSFVSDIEEPIFENTFIEDENWESERERIFLESQPQIMVDLHQKIEFRENCLLLKNEVNNFFYLLKDYIVVYEISTDFPHWLHFLKSIDGQKSIYQIIDNLQISFDSIEENLIELIKEEIIVYSK